MVATVWNPNPNTVTQANATGTLKQEQQIASANQRVFNIATFAYAPNTGSLMAFKNGVVLVSGADYVESSASSIILTNAATVGDKIFFVGFVGITGVVGTDTVLRSQLISGAGAAQISYLSPATGAVASNLATMLGERISVFRFMTEAQITNVQGLTHTVDVTAAIQAALDYAAPRSRSVYLPCGTYLISYSLKFVNSSRMFGDSQRACTIWGAAGMLTPLVNSSDGVSFTYVTISDIGFYYGANCIGVTITGEMAFNTFVRCDFFAAAGYDCFYASRLLQTAYFDSCNFLSGDHGIKCAGWTANLNTFINCKFSGQKKASVYFRSSEVNKFLTCNFGNVDVGGGAEAICIDVTDTRNLTFDNCYFENGHVSLLRETSSSNTIKFEDCHFTAATGGAKYTFTSDGRVNFGINHWYIPSDGPARIFMSGPNSGALPTLALGGPATKIDTIDAYSVHKIASGSVQYPVSAQIDLVKLAVTAQDNLLTSLSILTGELTVNFQSINAGGTGLTWFTRKYHVRASSVAGATMTATLSLVSSGDSAAGVTMTAQVKAGATYQLLTLEAVFTGFGAGPTGGSVMSWAFESDCAATSTLLQIFPTIA